MNRLTVLAIVCLTQPRKRCAQTAISTQTLRHEGDLLGSRTLSGASAAAINRDIANRHTHMVAVLMKAIVLYRASLLPQMNAQQRILSTAIHVIPTLAINITRKLQACSISETQPIQHAKASKKKIKTGPGARLGNWSQGTTMPTNRTVIMSGSHHLWLDHRCQKSTHMKKFWRCFIGSVRRGLTLFSTA